MLSRMIRRPLLAALLLTACSSSSEPAPKGPETQPPPPAPAPTPAPVSVAPVEWTPCKLYSEGGGPDAECAVIKTPLSRGDQAGPTIDVFVKRFKPKGGKSSRALWLLQGGPGASGYVFEKLSEQFATRFPDVDYYMPDHRGTGQSSRIGCPKEEAPTSDGGISITDAEWPSCLADMKAREGARLAQFNVTNAANDVGVMIERARTPGQPVFVMGISYGTYLAHRYLQLYPSQADGVIFDSLCPTGCNLARQDQDANEAMQDFMGACAADTKCKEKLGPDPWARAVALSAKLKAGHCAAIAAPGVSNAALFRRAFGQLLMNPQLRGYIPSMVYRLDRCDAGDVPALKVLVEQLTQEPPPSLEMKKWGWAVSQNIALSELWEKPSPSRAQLAEWREGVASRDVTTLFEPVADTWPRYEPDAYATTWADSAAPRLVLQGGLDPATLLRKARAAKPHFSQPNHYWVEIPTAGHTTFVTSATTEKRSCGTQIFMSFMDNPKVAPDTSCLAKLAPLSFDGQLQLSQALYGRDDAWEN